MKMRCTVCNWIYDEEVEGVPFSDLPDDYNCPICGAPKAAFVPAREGSDGKSVADALVENLTAIGVTRVYGIPGDSNLPLVEALRKNPDIDMIAVRHEHVGAFMATAHAKLTGELGVCLSIAGPGATNLMTGLMDAACDRAPVLALVGQVAGVYLGSEAFQEIDQIEMFRSFAVFAETLSQPSQLPRLFGLAVKAAHGRNGVSVLSLPTDALGEPAVDESWDAEERLFRPRITPQESDLDAAADRINEASRPAILAGWGARRADSEVRELVDRLAAPIATTSRGKGVIAEDHPMALGVLGSIGNRHAPAALAEADLLIVLGAGFRQRNLLSMEVPIIQIDHDPVRLGRNFPVQLGLTGDISATLAQILPRLQEREESSLVDVVDDARRRWRQEAEDTTGDKDGPVHPGRIIEELNRRVDDDAIISVDVGDHTYWFYRYFICSGEQVTLMSASMASMGFALPAALASAFENPGRQVICVTGDGGLGMVLADFTTAVMHDLNLTVVVFNDRCLKNIKKEQHRDGYPEYGVEMVNPDFAAFAESAGACGFSVKKSDELGEAIERALAHEGPAMIDVKVDPEVMLPGVKQIR